MPQSCAGLPISPLFRRSQYWLILRNSFDVAPTLSPPREGSPRRNARIGQSLAEYYPKISLSGFLGNEAISPGNLFRERGFQPSAVAGLRWRLFDFGRVDAEVRQAKGANAEALLQYRSSVLHAAEDVENSFTLLAQSEGRSDEILREIGALQRVRDRSQEAYQAGAIGLTDVLDADRQLLVARDDLALTKETVARAAVGSFRALGGGWAP